MQSGRAAQLKTTSLPGHRSTPRWRLSTEGVFLRGYTFRGSGHRHHPPAMGIYLLQGVIRRCTQFVALSAGSEEHPASKKDIAAEGKQLEQPSSGLQGQQQVAASSGADDGSDATAAQDRTSGAAVQSPSGGSGQGPPPAGKPSDSDAQELVKRYIDMQDAGGKFRRACVEAVGVTFGLATA